MGGGAGFDCRIDPDSFEALGEAVAERTQVAQPGMAEEPDVLRGIMRHNKRNLGEYEGLLEVDERLVKDLIAATQKVAEALGTA